MLINIDMSIRSWNGEIPEANYNKIFRGKTMNKYDKYHNRDSRCHYPFENNPLGYCWSFAGFVDGGKRDYEEFEKTHCEKCDEWREDGKEENE